MRSSVIHRALVVAGVASLAVGLAAGTAGAGPKGKQYGKLAAKSCAKERKALGNKTFAEVYGKPAMPNCIGVTRPEVREATKNASQECRAERADIGVDAFREQYGTNENKRNAFGKCVSGKRKAEMREEREDTINAARECKAEREDPAFADSHDGKTFAEFYGTNPNKKNAFGKCVSGKAQASEEDPA
jgi:hypothetical protein